MDAEKRNKLATRVGGAAGFVLYLVVGLIPSLLFGGHAGLLLTNAIIGPEAQQTITAKMLVGGGMVLGFVVGLFCFVLLGAIVSAGVCNLLYHGAAKTVEAADKAKENPIQADK